MTNMKTLKRIVFVIFIANGIDCLGEVCDNCCDCLKISKDEKITAESLVNVFWYKAKKDDLALMIFVKEDDNIFTSKDNKYKISIESDEEGNHKIVCQNEAGDELKLKDKKYALFEIKTKKGKTVYLYCNDVESSKNNYGMFSFKDHKSISVIACDTEKVTDMKFMFSRCSSLTELNFGNNFDTKNVTNMGRIFDGCSLPQETQDKILGKNK